MKVGKELDELHVKAEKMYSYAVLSIRERFKLSKTVDKQIESILYNLNTYELMQRELEKLIKFSELSMNTEELSTIEGELRELHDNFWN